MKTVQLMAQIGIVNKLTFSFSHLKYQNKILARYSLIKNNVNKGSLIWYKFYPKHFFNIPSIDPITPIPRSDSDSSIRLPCRSSLAVFISLSLVSHVFEYVPGVEVSRRRGFRQVCE